MTIFGQHDAHADTTLYPWNRNDRTGFLISTIGPAVIVILANILYAWAGFNESDPAYEAVSFNPPGWVIGLVWVIIYPMWGAARWYARQTGLAGRRRSRWIIALMAWGLLYPIATWAIESTAFSAGANVFSLLLAFVTAWQVHGVTKRGFWLIAPSLAWLSFATLLGFAALSNA